MPLEILLASPNVSPVGGIAGAVLGPIEISLPSGIKKRNSRKQTVATNLAIFAKHATQMSCFSGNGWLLMSEAIVGTARLHGQRSWLKGAELRFPTDEGCVIVREAMRIGESVRRSFLRDPFSVRFFFLLLFSLSFFRFSASRDPVWGRFRFSAERRGRFALFFFFLQGIRSVGP